MLQAMDMGECALVTGGQDFRVEVSAKACLPKPLDQVCIGGSASAQFTRKDLQRTVSNAAGRAFRATVKHTVNSAARHQRLKNR